MWKNSEIILLLLYYISIVGFTNGNNTYIGLYQISSIKGKEIRLPCDITPPQGDTVSMVIWYKSDKDMPIYIYDSRSKAIPSHWSDDSILRSRGSFENTLIPPALIIVQAEETDSSFYRCRVDFRKSKTKNFLHNVTIIVPPVSIRITDERNQELTSTTGSYSEGQEMTLLCSVSGGTPPPSVYWWKDSLLSDTSYFSPTPGVYQNFLNVSKLSRLDMNSNFSCTGDNTNMTAPLIRSVSVNMFLVPTEARIIIHNELLIASKPTRISCLVFGSRPPAEIQWFLNGDILLVTETTEAGIHEGETTRSTIMFTPTASDDKKQLTCRATNHMVSGLNFIEESTRLPVEYPPLARVRLGRGIRPDNIKEGDDVYFECKTTSNPAPSKIIWKKDGNILSNKIGSGHFLTSHSLVIRQVTRKASGSYTCSATNLRGTGESSPIQLDVLRSPTCLQSQRVDVTASKGETVYLPCVLESYPPAVKIKWHFNRTAEFIDMTINQIMVTSIDELKNKDLLPILENLNLTSSFLRKHDLSVLKIQPNTSQDFGFFYCLGTNIIGSTKQPCVFNVLESEIPHTPANCTVKMPTKSSIDVECNESFDGNLQQNFLLEILDVQTNEVLFNLTSRTPEFSFLLEGQTSSVRSYHVTIDEQQAEFTNSTIVCKIYSFNKLGKSEPALLQTVVRRLIDSSNEKSTETSYLTIIGCISGGLLVAVLLATIIIMGRRKKKSLEYMACRTLEVHQRGSTMKTSLSTKSTDGGFQELAPREKGYIISSTTATSLYPYLASNLANKDYSSVDLDVKSMLHGNPHNFVNQFSPLPRSCLPVPEGKSDGPDLPVDDETKSVHYKPGKLPVPLKLTNSWKSSNL
ncbi:hemicentin-1-like isoform X2 [Artemia franciscana]